MSKALFVQKKIRNTHKIRRKNEISIKNLQDTRSQDYRQGAETFFERKKMVAKISFGRKKGAKTCFWKKKRGQGLFLQEKRGANSFL